MFSPTGWLAVYRTDEEIRLKRPGRCLPVDGWDADGDALVVDAARGRRRPASDLQHFRGLQKAEAAIAGVVPGQGWHVAYRDGAAADPVVAWNVDTNGWAVPILANSDGYAEPYDPENDFLVPPGADADASPYRGDR
jgi:hypothetical protein